MMILCLIVVLREQPVVIPNAVRAEVSTVILNNDVADVCSTNVFDLYIKLPVNPR